MMSKLRSVSRVSLLCAALLLAAACGSADSLVPNAPASTQDPPAVAPAASVTIRLSGAGAQVYRTFNVTIDQIDVRVDGSPTEVVPGARMVDVASGTEAVLARFPLPQPGSTVRVACRADPFSGPGRGPARHGKLAVAGRRISPRALTGPRGLLLTQAPCSDSGATGT